MKYFLFLILSSCAIGNIGESTQFLTKDQSQENLISNKYKLSFESIFDPYSNDNYSQLNISNECRNYYKIDPLMENIEPICVSAKSYYDFYGIETSFNDFGLCALRCKTIYSNFKMQSYANCDDDWTNGCETEFYKPKDNCTYSMIK